MLITQTVTHKGQGDPLEVTVSEATALMGMRRSVLISEALTFIRAQRDESPPEEAAKTTTWADDDASLAIYLLRRYAWPDCIACTTGSKGLDHTSLTFDEFCELPEVFIGLWQQAARELNPHWGGEPEEAEEEGAAEAGKKKAPDPEESQSGTDRVAP